MKKMSEVFELPLAGEENQGEPFLADATCYFASFDDALTFEDGKGLERAQHAAHAINHVDALADALEALVSDYNQYRAVNGIDLTDDHCAKLDVKMATAESALKAYRGEK